MSIESAFVLEDKLNEFNSLLRREYSQIIELVKKCKLERCGNNERFDPNGIKADACKIIYPQSSMITVSGFNNTNDAIMTVALCHDCYIKNIESIILKYPKTILKRSDFNNYSCDHIFLYGDIKVFNYQKKESRPLTSDDVKSAFSILNAKQLKDEEINLYKKNVDMLKLFFYHPHDISTNISDLFEKINTFLLEVESVKSLKYTTNAH